MEKMYISNDLGEHSALKNKDFDAYSLKRFKRLLNKALAVDLAKYEIWA